MALKIGDKVRFLNETGEGIITQFNNKKVALVEIEEGFEIPVLVSQLVKVEIEDKRAEIVPQSKAVRKDNIKGIKKIIIEKESREDVENRRSKRHTKNNEITEEVDLHIERLINSHRGMSNGEIIIIQLNYFRSRLDKAIEHNVQKIVFIHGVGNGVLKAEILKVLSTYSGIAFHDASYRQYGFGATEVIIK